MRRHRVDTTLALLATLADGWSRLPPEDQRRLARHVELVRFRAGDSLGGAGRSGRWCTAVVKGTVATTNPRVTHGVGSTVEHGSDTALVALEDGVILTWPANLVDAHGTALRLYPLTGRLAPAG